jgi:hypothetical protein
MPKAIKFDARDWNFVAKRFRETDWWRESNSPIALARRASLTQLALEFADKYSQDNPGFDPLNFLDRCSPDIDRMPFSELWEAYIEGR